MKSWTPVILAIVALAFGAFVWPTPFRYDHHADRLVRINRMTGVAEILAAGGWHRMQ